jgi:3-oxoacyl-[acyl-carrier protein] reductase
MVCELTHQRNVLIAGASSSIGIPVTERFVGAGDAVLATYFTGGSKFSALLSGGKGVLTVAQLDVTSEDSRERFVREDVPAFAPLDVVLLLAGYLPGESLADYDTAKVEPVMAINFVGQALLLKQLLPRLGQDSHVIMMSSIAAQRGSYDPLYAAAKGAVLPFVKSMVRALAGKARINAVAPALIEGSTMYDDMAPEIRANHRSSTPTSRLVQIEDLAAQLFDLCQPHWHNLNGACIDLNGGQDMR